MDASGTSSDRLTTLFGAWIAMLFALYPAIVATGVGGMILAGLLQGTAEGVATIPVSALYVLVLGLVFGIPLAFIFSLLALPLLALRRFIVGPRRPWLLPGYISVILYGPALIVIACEGWRPDQWPAIWLYESVALIATAIYVRLTRTSSAPALTA